MENFFGFLGAYYVIPSIIIGFIGFLLGWFLKPSTKQAGDLSIEGEGALRAEADSLRARVQDLEGRLSGRDTEISTLKTELAAGAPTAAAAATTKTTDADETYALEWQNRYLAARVKYLDSRLAELGTDAVAPQPAAKAKAATKTAAAKKTSAKKTPAAKKPAAKKAPAKKAAPKAQAAPKAKAVATTATAIKAAAKKKPAAKKSPAKKSGTDYDKYYEKVKVYDGRASKAVVKNIVNYCGVSLRSRDSSLVACTDETELKTVADGFVTKKLGLEEGQMELVKSVCEQMKGTRLKSRVTFYYLAAKKAKKLDLFK